MGPWKQHETAPKTLRPPRHPASQLKSKLYMCIHTNHLRVYIHIHICIHIHTCIYMYTHTVYMSIRMYICTYIYIPTYVCTHVRVYICTYIYMYVDGGRAASREGTAGSLKLRAATMEVGSLPRPRRTAWAQGPAAGSLASTCASWVKARIPLEGFKRYRFTCNVGT